MRFCPQWHFFALSFFLFSIHLAHVKFHCGLILPPVPPALRPFPLTRALQRERKEERTDLHLLSTSCSWNADDNLTFALFNVLLPVKTFSLFISPRRVNCLSSGSNCCLWPTECLFYSYLRFASCLCLQIALLVPRRWRILHQQRALYSS